MKTVRNLSSSGNYDEKDYQELLHDTIAVIESSRVRIAKQINTSIISSHWEIGKLLEERKLDSKHGDQIVKRLSVDLKGRYPNMGLSPRNLWEMKRSHLRTSVNCFTGNTLRKQRGQRISKLQTECGSRSIMSLK